MDPTPEFNSNLEYFEFYSKNPLNFLNDFVQKVSFKYEKNSIYIWSRLQQIIESVARNKNTVVVSGNGVGKTFVSSLIATWFLCTNKDSIVITTAPTWHQVKNLLWGEIRERFKTARKQLATCPINQTNIQISDKWYAIGLSTDEEERFQGFHAKDILVIVDEASGVDEKIFKAISGILNSDGAKLLAIGNPNSKDSRFFEITQLQDYNAITIPATEHPNYIAGLAARNRYSTAEWNSYTFGEKEVILEEANIIPGAVTYLGCESIMNDYGKESPVYQVRVLAQFPTEEDDALIPYAWIQRHIREDEAPPITKSFRGGADIARKGENETVLTFRKGNYVFDQICWKKKDLVDTYNRIELEVLSKYKKEDGFVSIDADGLGSGVFDNLNRRKKIKVKDFHGGLPAKNKDKFVNRKSELFWRLRLKFEDINKGSIIIPDDKILHAQLSSMKFKLDTRGRIYIERKEDMLSRGIKSPDRADSLMMSEDTTNYIKVNDFKCVGQLVSF